LNRKQIASILAGALALPLMAQAQTANVTLYGRIHTDVEFLKGRQADGSNPNIWRLSGNSSRFGLRGEEALSGDLSAIFQAEFGISTDSNVNTNQNTGPYNVNNVITYRDTFVGLASKSIGTVRFGMFTGPTDSIENFYFSNKITLATSVLNPINIWANNANVVRGAGGFDNRYGNAVRYDTPLLAGFSGAAQNAIYENARHGNIADVFIQWKGGPFSIGAAYAVDTKVRNVDTEDKDASIAASWQIGNWNIAGVYERMKLQGTGIDAKRNFWGVSANGTYGPHQFYLFYGDANDWSGSGALATGIHTILTGSDTGANQFVVTYGYQLSKRTGTYIGYHKVDNDARANYTFAINPYGVGAGGDPQTVAIGMYHLF